MVLELNEYVRTKDGIIAKVIGVQSGGIEKYFLDKEIPMLNFLNQLSAENVVVKHSFNIIDLIEEGDFVKLEYYVAKYKKRITRFFEISKIDGWQFVGLENEHCHFTYDLEKNRWLDGKGYNPKIKSIVTKQQMEAMGYEVK